MLGVCICEWIKLNDCCIRFKLQSSRQARSELIWVWLRTSQNLLIHFQPTPLVCHPSNTVWHPGWTRFRPKGKMWGLANTNCHRHFSQHLNTLPLSIARTFGVNLSAGFSLLQGKWDYSSCAQNSDHRGKHKFKYYDCFIVEMKLKINLWAQLLKVIKYSVSAREKGALFPLSRKAWILCIAWTIAFQAATFAYCISFFSRRIHNII